MPAYAMAAQEVATAPIPNWVTPVELPDTSAPPENTSGGVWYVLLDRQAVIEDSVHRFFLRISKMVTDRSGTEDAGQITISFDPAYQRIVLHELKLIRGVETLDRLDSARIELLRREEDLDSNILDGQLSANIVVEDIRVGDIVEYAYSLDEDPELHDRTFTYNFTTEFSVPLERFHSRVDWPAKRDLSIQHHETDISASSWIEGDRRVMVWRADKLQALSDEDAVPDWHDRYGWVQLTSFPNWAAVSAWMTPYYRLGERPGAEVLAIADQIRREAASKPDQIMRALKYAQHEIRYTGIELGMRSFVPHRPAETVNRGYGDCKDKTILLIQLLRVLGFDAVPALVHLDTGEGVDRMLPTPWAFNHVITRVSHAGKTYWLDATDTYQGEALSTVSQPDLGYALLLQGSGGDLVRMPQAQHEEPSRHTIERFSFSNGWAGDAELYVESVFRAADAETIRSNVARQSAAELEQTYRNYYAQTYPTIQTVEPLRLVDDPLANEFRTYESYKIERDKEADSVFEALTLEAYSINSVYDAPETVQRDTPFEVATPINRSHIVEVLAPDVVFEAMDDVKLDGKAFSFQLDTSFIDGGVRLTHDLKSKASYVPADAISQFIADVDVLDHKTYHKYWEIIADDQGDSASEDENLETYLILALLLIAVVLGGLGLYFGLRADKGYAQDAVYYPVPVWKFLLLNFVTFRLYQVFWCWKFWRWTKSRDQSDILPFWRAFFYIFWTPVVVGDFRERYPEVAPPMALGWVLLIVEIAASVSVWLFDVDHYGYWLGFLIPCLFWIPLVSAIATASGRDSHAYKMNARLGAISIIWITVFSIIAVLAVIGTIMAA